MKTNLEQKIKDIVDKANVSDWKNVHADIEGMELKYMYTIYTMIKLTVKNGKKYIIGVYATNIIDREDWEKQTYKELEILKELKVRNAKDFLFTYIMDNYFTGRTGLLRHRGYFKFTNIEEYKTLESN